MMIKKRILIAVFTILSMVVLVACASQPGSPASTPDPDQPVSSNDTPEPPTQEPAPGNNILGETAQVESIQVLILESFPVQAVANVTGNLPDGCTKINRVEAIKEGNTFQIKILTERPVDAICTQQLVPFEENVPLDVYGLSAGTYTVEAYGKQTTFTLSMDNILPTESICPLAGEGMQLFSQEFPNVGTGICFLYPQDFEAQPNTVSEMVTISGPDHGGGPEPVEAFVTINTIDPAGKDLQVYVDEQIAATAQGLEVRQETTTLGAQTQAIRVEGLPGRTGTRVVYAEHSGIIYILTFAPLDEAFPEATADMERLYEAVMTSWVFLQ